MVGIDEVVGRIGEEKAGPRCAAVRSEPVESRFSASAGDALLGTGGKRRLFQIPFGKLAAGGAHAPLVLSLVRYGRHAYDRVVAIGRDYTGSVAQFGRGRPSRTARMPRLTWFRNIVTPRSVALRCSRP